ncbi:SdpI family protein [Parvularcula flava]|uniref:Immunity protein SdpI n=1 Tax=Aquisalinus luteolus TaxID=1566827 RepID=A0A8J3A0E6_9PROT|nr:SdpI family protein [Aquisalinus luteolus]NHK26592.1 SdpI family protein [Aquisalinus luteolus]GGH92806.1 immunity protein SdpI [Aquisalinus luteolus]
MNIRGSLIITGIVIVAMAVASVWAFFQPGPHEVPVHWGLSGEPDRYASRLNALVSLPLVALAISAILAIAGKVDPRRANIERSGPAYRIAWLGTLGMLAIGHGVIVATALGQDVPVARIIGAAVGVLLVALGDVIGKSKSNFTVGVRTPWTLSSERSWNKTNRAGGRLFVAIGILGAVSAFLAPPWVTLSIFLGGSIAIAGFSLVYSWIVWREERRGTPG